LDFYPNGGLHQPGCDGGVRWISDALFRFCSHGRAVDYFIESVKRKKAFPSVVCDDYAKFKSGHCKDCFRTGECISMGYDAGLPQTVWDASSMQSSISHHQSPPSSSSSPLSPALPHQPRKKQTSVKLFLDTLSMIPYTATSYIHIRMRIGRNYGSVPVGHIFIKIGEGKDAAFYGATQSQHIHAFRAGSRVDSFQLLKNPSSKIRRLNRVSLSFTSASASPVVPMAWIVGTRYSFYKPKLLRIDSLEVFVVNFASNESRAIFYSNRALLLQHGRWKSIFNSKND